MRDTVVYVGQFKLPDRDAAATRVRAVADALNLAGYKVTLIGDDYTGPAGTDRSLPARRRMTIAGKRGFDYLFAASGYLRRMRSLDWPTIAAVICYPGSAALVWRLRRLCRRRAIPFIIDSTEWFETEHTLGGRFGPFALDSELRMRWLHKRAGNLVCISSFLTAYYARQGCNVIRIPPLLGADAECFPNGSPISSEAQTAALTLVYAGFSGRKELLSEIVGGVQGARRHGIDVSLRVVGLTEAQLSTTLKRDGAPPDLDGIACHGWLRRDAARRIVAAADFTVILRPQRRFANAGFPSKFVESLSLGVPVIANGTSDIPEYLKDGLDGFLLNEPTARALECVIVRSAQLSREERNQMRRHARDCALRCFGYRNFSAALGEFIASARPCI